MKGGGAVRCGESRVFTKFRILEISYISNVFFIFRILFESGNNFAKIIEIGGSFWGHGGSFWGHGGSSWGRVGSPWSLACSPGALEAHPGAMEAHPGPVEVILGPWGPVHPLAGKAHPEVPHLEP